MHVHVSHRHLSMRWCSMCDCKFKCACFLMRGRTDVNMRDSIWSRGRQAPFGRPSWHGGLHRHTIAMCHLTNSHVVLERHRHSHQQLSRNLRCLASFAARASQEKLWLHCIPALTPQQPFKQHGHGNLRLQARHSSGRHF